MRAKMIWLGAMLLVLGWVSSGQAGDKPKIAYIDIQEVLLNSRAGLEAKGTLAKESEARKKLLEDKDRDLKKLKEELDRKGAALSSEARSRKEAEFTKKQEDFRELLSKMENELQRKDYELTQTILKELEGIIENLGKRGKYDLILEKNEGTVLYAPKDYDITSQLIKLYDEENRTEPKK
ncbi:MAG: OmpH family outer membrane protein [Proteobacteria bacterium]|nr:OmpH family outer membrane protein [Pseudomonadota bacterium]